MNIAGVSTLCYFDTLNTVANTLNTSPLDIARTFRHEMINAEMYRKLLLLSAKKEIPLSFEFIESIRNNDVKAWVDLPAEKKTEIEALANRVDRFSRTVPCPN